MDFTYDGTEKLKVEFGAKEGCSISGIWVDLRQYRGDELKEADVYKRQVIRNLCCGNSVEQET